MSPNPKLLRLNNEGKTESVIRHLVEMVELGLLAQGERLPSEAVLASQLQVATVTLREALADLRKRGLIETRRGRSGGSFVRAVSVDADDLLFKHLENLSILELRDYADEHVAVAGAAAKLAALRAGPQQHSRLKSHLDALRDTTTRRERRQMDARFHIEIAASAQSVRLTHAETRLQAELGQLIWLPHQGQSQPEEIEREHEAILQAIVTGDSNLAGALAESHVKREVRRLSELRLVQIANKASTVA